MATVFAVGFSDQFPCARNRFNFGIGATLFLCESDACEFKGDTLHSIQSFLVDDAHLAIDRQDAAQRCHAENMGCSWSSPKRSQIQAP